MNNRPVAATLAAPGMLAVFLVALLGADVARSDSAGGDAPPWLLPETAGEYLLIPTGRDSRPPRLGRMTVYHVPTGEVVAEGWGGPSGGWDGSSGAWGKIGQLVQDAPGHLWRGHGVMNLADAQFVNHSSLERETHVIAADLRRAVVIDNGDLWRGEIDWATGEIVNRHRVTQVGLFRDDMRAIIWHGNDLYLAAGFDRDKPIVRVDLVSEQLDELAVPPAFNPVIGSPAALRSGATMGLNPPGWLIVRPEGQVVHVLDLRTDRATTLPNPVPPTYRWSGDEDLQWLDDTTALLESRAGIFRFDFTSDRVSELTRYHELGSAGNWVRSLDDGITGLSLRGILDGGQWAMVSAKQTLPLPTGGRGEQIAYAQRQDEVPSALFLLNLASGETEPIDLDGPPPYVRPGFQPYDEWLDAQHYVFTRMEGGLAQIGTWLYDRESGETRRLSQTPSVGGRLFFADIGTIVFTELILTAQNTVETGANYLVSLDGSGLTELPPGIAGFAWILDEPIDLGLGNRQTGLWTEPEDAGGTNVSATRGGDAAHDDPLPTVGLTDEMRLAQGIADMPAEDQAIVSHAFEQVIATVHLSNHYDPVAFALRFQKEYRRLEPTADRPFDLPGDGGWVAYRHVLAEGDFRPALSQDRIARNVGERALSMAGDAEWFTPAVQHAIVERYADEARANPQRIWNARSATQLFVEILTEQRRLHGGP